jgi:hypothetical protein
MESSPKTAAMASGLLSDCSSTSAAFFYQRSQRRIAGIVNLCPVPVNKQEFPFVFRQHGQAIDFLGIVCQHCIKKGAEVPKVALNPLLFKQRGGVFNSACDCVTRFPQIQGKVKHR